MTSTAPASKSPTRRTRLIDALRAAAALVILWHHFALYGPLSEWVTPIAGRLMHFLEHYGRATQIFFVIGGYVLARSMSKRTWHIGRVGRYVVHRYLRLGLPYLGAIALAIAACAFGRGWLDVEVVGPPPTWSQLFAHLAFLQDILEIKSFSAGLWFVCINFQLSLVFVAMLWLRDAADRRPVEVVSQAPPEATGRHHAERDGYYGPLVSLIGWGLAASSLFYFNLHSRFEAWFIYFFPHFYLGVIIHQALSRPRREILFWLYVALVVAALAWSLYLKLTTGEHFGTRWRLVTTLVCGLLLFAGGKLGFMETWPKSRVIGYLGRTSYSLFLVHFPVLVVVATVWRRLSWYSPWQAAGGLATAFLLSLVVSDLFYRTVENPAKIVSRRVKY